MPNLSTEATSHIQTVQNNQCWKQLFCDHSVQCPSNKDSSGKAPVSLSQCFDLIACFNTSWNGHVLHLTILYQRKTDFIMFQCFQDLNVLASTALCCVSPDKLSKISSCFCFLFWKNSGKKDFCIPNFYLASRDSKHTQIFLLICFIQAHSRFTASAKKRLHDRRTLTKRDIIWVLRKWEKRVVIACWLHRTAYAKMPRSHHWERWKELSPRSINIKILDLEFICVVLL